MVAPHGSFAEYAVAWDHSTFHLPNNISFEQGATLPLAAMTAAVGMYLRLGLPEPWRPAREPTPIIVWGASGAVGSFAVQLAQASNLHPIIAIAGNSSAHVEKLISRDEGDAVVDYRGGEEAVVKGIQDALKQAGLEKVHYAFDAISEHGSFQTISKALAKENSRISLILPASDYSEIPSHIEQSIMMVGAVHGMLMPGQQVDSLDVQAWKDFGYIFFKWFGQAMREGRFSPHPYTVVPGGLNGVEKGLTDLKAGKASATKFIFKIEDTKQ
jgi:NADPH2:quinone reductase